MNAENNQARAGRRLEVYVEVGSGIMDPVKQEQQPPSQPQQTPHQIPPQQVIPQNNK